MASARHHRLPRHDTEARCGAGGAVAVRLSSSSSSPKPCQCSVSSSFSSGGSGARRRVAAGQRARRKVPQLFERSAAQCWDPQFDSAIMEEACRERCFPQTRRRFRYVLLYLSVASVWWGAYFGINASRCDPATFLLPTASFLLLCLLLFLFTFTKPYALLSNQASLLLVMATFVITLAPQMHAAGFGAQRPAQAGNGSLAGRPAASCVSPVGTFSLCMEVLLLLYSFLHMRLYASVLLGFVYSVAFEALGWLALGGAGEPLDTAAWLGPAKAALHSCAHLIGIHLFIMSEVRSRSTFLKVGQAIMHGKDLEVEKALKERMIHSVMPRCVADELMKQGDEDSESSGKRYSTGNAAATASSSSPKNHKRKKTSIPQGQINFRRFNMKRMEPVSILFADIVGFTKMSANKSAPALVGLLNDLFGRFDRLCELTCCEKISTLGDCYYCVAGCPEPLRGHAFCCVEMGLEMIQAIEQFCQESGETVDMRVGVHTGTVLCGILGMKRLKFDVWSNDVNLANLMEQLGVAGKVHLSEATAAFLDDRYQCEDGRVAERVGAGVVAEQLRGLKTYLISGRKTEAPQCGCPPLSFLCQEYEDSASHHVCVPEPVALDAPSYSLKSPKTLNGFPSQPSGGMVMASQTSLSEMLQDNDHKWEGAGRVGGAVDHSALIPLRSKNFRDRSDAHFVNVIKDDSLMDEYIFKPPLNKLSLNFLQPSLELAYRTSYQKEVETQAPVQTFASPTFSSFLDVLLSCAVFFALTVACFLWPMVTAETPSVFTVVVAVIAALLEIISLVFSICMTFYLDDVLNCTQKLLRGVSGWIPRHAIGALLVSLPALSVFTHLICNLHLPIQVTMFLCCAIIIAIIQYCNFCQLSFWMRSALATAAGVALLLLLYRPLKASYSYDGTGYLNSSSISHTDSRHFQDHSALLELLVPEAVLAFFLLLLLVWFLNREFEVSYRLHYHGNVEADKHRIKIQNMRDQADWLLRNIIPIHVAEQLKVTQSYSKNHDNVGVIFASIVNFSEFYEESFEGGKECYRVLNELIGDFDELLHKPDFASVEKIKTIGATYMAASGLNGLTTPHDTPQHLDALFKFALEMMRVVDDFNNNMLGFKFKLRIGFNHGPLTAGVIGTTKLLYDIWGDTVNIASRMDTTGVECRVQVSEESHAVLSSIGYAFEYRGTVNVKGKGQMRTYLYPKEVDGGNCICGQHLANHEQEICAKVEGSTRCTAANTPLFCSSLSVPGDPDVPTSHIVCGMDDEGSSETFRRDSQECTVPAVTDAVPQPSEDKLFLLPDPMGQGAVDEGADERAKLRNSECP
ncbi:adenylate cyclase type 9-like [Denticeps clupeoides]|uniref:adenylate cyclase n=1 Tax=Denticeps clupeoides TaxID=299321 RepID=A0AAY4E659_9TELE|nr:adenylate cyclase type 9-like [Denticeps clupeoides]